MTVSVVIPCYNREQILPRAIESAVSQTVCPHEIVVVDDGSRDGSAKVARSFGDLVRVVEQPNAGAAAARNRGIEVATGDWIAFLDSDDEWDARKLELQLAAASRFPEAKLVFCDTIVRSDKEVLMPSRFALGGLYGEERERDGAFAVYDRSLFSRMLNQSRVITSAVMVRRELPELQFPEKIWGSEDWGLWLTLAIHYRFASVDQVLVTMHQQGDNISSVKGKLYRNDTYVLGELLADGSLTDPEREAVTATLNRRRVGAIYHSLVAGDTVEARPLLKRVSVSDLGFFRYPIYRLLSLLPGSVVRRIARGRRAAEG